MGYVRLTGTHKNTTGPETTWRIDVIDSRYDFGQSINFIIDKGPSIRYDGLPQELTPGYYPTSFTFGMMIEQNATNRGGTTYGPNEGFLDDLFLNPEGTFFVKLYKDGELVFIGAIIPDQCSFEDQYYPYALHITAADGSYKWQTEEYVSTYGTIAYKTLKREWPDGNLEFSSTPVVTDQSGYTLEGTEWVVIEHISKITVVNHFPGQPAVTSSYRATTYARYEQYTVESPDPDDVTWVDQGGSLWAKEVTYTDEELVNESSLYHLTRNLVETPFVVVSDFFKKAIELIPTKDEYAGVMYDEVGTWYEHRMTNFTSSPFTMMRVNETTIAIGKKWDEVINNLAKHLYLRIYYSNARFHFEQISERGETYITRHKYDSEGVSLGSETVNLDLNYNTLDIHTGDGGSYKFMAPLKNVLVTHKIKDPNLLKYQKWISDTKFNEGQSGQRYLGRITKTESDFRFLLQINCEFVGVFDITTWASLSEVMQLLSTPSRQYVSIQVRIRNVQLDTHYFLTPATVDNASENSSTWGTSALDGRFYKYVTFIPVAGTWKPQSADFNFRTLSDALPGSVGDTFDVYISVNFNAHWLEPDASKFWVEQNPTKYFHRRTALSNSLTTVNSDEEAVSSDAARAYEVVNDPNNSLTAEIEAAFGDYGKDGDHIEAYNGTYWYRTRGWSRNGTGTEREFLALLSQEVASLRVLPLRIYSGAFFTPLLSTQNRLQRDNLYYLPLKVNHTLDFDSFQGDFINIAKTQAPSPTTLVTPFVGEPLPGLIDADVTEQDFPLFFVTNEPITGSPTLTEVDIVNSLGVYVGSGETVTIINLETGVTENVTLTQNVTPDSVVMYFSSHTFTNAFPTGSPIHLMVEDGLTQETPNEYKFSQYNYSASEHEAPTYNFPNPEGNTQAAIDRRINIWRNGNKMVYRSVAAGPAEYSINYAAKKFTFPIAFAGEYIQIHAK